MRLSPPRTGGDSPGTLNWIFLNRGRCRQHRPSTLIESTWPSPPGRLSNDESTLKPTHTASRTPLLPNLWQHLSTLSWFILGIAIFVAVLWTTPLSASGTTSNPPSLDGTNSTQHWSFRPLSSAPPPKAPSTSTHPRTPVDSFWLSALTARQLEPAPPASRQKLIRRLALDLTGIPPTPDEIDAFEHDTAVDAYERLVEACLNSPRFGERWGRHWLDLVRYADSAGFERDTDRPTVWHYRDWVIRAFNNDLPFDTFLHWQLAGDQLEPQLTEARIATAFLGLGTVIESDTKLPDEVARYRYADLDDMLSTTGSAMLGLTVGCARCHDHKYDPIPTRDYYRLLCAFTPVERTEWALAQPIGTNAAPTGLTVTDAAVVPANFLMKRGDPTSPAEPVRLGFLSILARGPHAGDPSDVPHQDRARLARWMTDPDNGAGALVARVIVNRLWQHHFGQPLVGTPSDFGTQGDTPTHPELLDWLASELVRGGWKLKPIHRLILLSACYQQDDTGDRQQQAVDPANRWLWHRRPQRIESETLRDSLLAVSGTMNPAIGGPGVKAPVPPELHTAYNTKDPYPNDAADSPLTRRRSVYLFTKRSLRQPLLELFDGADPSASCARRLTTTVAPQALALLNDEFVRARALDFARRLRREAGLDQVSTITHAYRLALGRRPTVSERTMAARFLDSQMSARRSREGDAALLATADFCQVLFGLNEFVYVD